MMKNKDQEIHTKSNTLSAVATCVVIGAGVVAASAAILQDRKKREKIKKVVKNVKRHVTGYMNDIQKKADEKNKEEKIKANENKEVLKNKVEKSIDAVQDTLEETKKNL